MSLALLKSNRLHDKWKIKLSKYWETHHQKVNQSMQSRDKNKDNVVDSKKAVWTSRFALILIPLITVLREGLEAVVFLGGVSKIRKWNLKNSVILISS